MSGLTENNIVSEDKCMKTNEIENSIPREPITKIVGEIDPIENSIPQEPIRKIVRGVDLIKNSILQEPIRKFV